MSLGERLKQLARQQNMTQKDFAESIGSNERTFSHYTTGGASPNFKFIERVLNGVPNLSAEWLCRGKGPMWTEGKEESSSTKKEKPSKALSDGKRDWGEVTLRELGEMVEEAKKSKPK